MVEQCHIYLKPNTAMPEQKESAVIPQNMVKKAFNIFTP